MTTDSLPGSVARSTVAVGAKRSRVAVLVAAAASVDRWHATLRPDDPQRRMCRERQPQLADFVTDAPERLADCRAMPSAQLLQRLCRAQDELLQTVAGVGATDLDRTGLHAVNGRISVADVLDFLPTHQGDHAQQLAAQLR